MDNKLLDELRKIVGADHVHASRTDAEVYSYDASVVTGAPDAVVFPADVPQTADVVRALGTAGVPCIARGFGTNMSGGTVAPRGGVVVSLTRMDRILAIAPERRMAVVEPGVTNLELQDALAPLGFFYAPDPASQKAATMGGNIAENSGGPHCVKYGVTTNHVLGMQVILPDGDIVHLGAAAFDPPGLDLRGLMIGSEGMLGIVTEIAVRIMPLPERVVTLLAIYDNVSDAARSVSGIIAEGIVPATLEMMDQPIMHAIEDSLACGYPRDAAAVLIIEVEGLDAGLDEQAESIERICTANHCRSIHRARSEAERDQLWTGRRGAFGALARIAPNFLVCDCTVPRTRLPEALDQTAAISRHHGFKYGNVFHAGDGNLHPVVFFDSRNAGDADRVHQTGYEIMEACVALGGTITGEHGVGMEKIKAMRMLFSDDDLDLQRTLHRVFDPHELFNPGKIFPECNASDPPSGEPERELSGDLRPATVDEACEMVRAACLTDTALVPVGGGRRADFGNAPSRDLTPLHSTSLAPAMECDADNQVAILGAGTTLAAAQELLAPHNQWLPFRPPLADGGTIGGLVALGTCGPERLAYGAPRDRLLGLRFVSGNGHHIKAGGRVMKNVAGYDVTRLIAGSAGTLGFVTEATFRTEAIPEVCRAVTARGTLDACAAGAASALGCNLGPTFVTAVPAGDGDPAAWVLRVGFEGFDITVRAQEQRCAELLAEAGIADAGTESFDIHHGPHADQFVELSAQPVVLRADVPIGAAAGFVERASGALADATVIVDFGCGRVSVGLGSLSDEAWTRVSIEADDVRGHVVLEQVPIDFRRRHSVFGTARASWEVMHRVKAALDPHNIFAPGRLPGRK